MKTISRLTALIPKLPDRYRSLPLLGALLNDFVGWLEPQGYAASSIRQFLGALCPVVRWLQRRKIGSLRRLTPKLLVQADVHFRPKQPNISGAIRALHRFLRERQAIPDPKPPALPPSHVEAECFAAYLRDVRGLAESTVRTGRQRVIRFLTFIGFNRQQVQLRRLRREQIEKFMRLTARTHNRFSLLQVAVTLRSFLRFEFSQGKLAAPLHDEVDMPRVYLGERLPRAVPWEQVRRLLQSIGRSDALGLRDFTILYLAAAYGLRCGELVRLRLEDLDWREATLRVRQTKTQQVLHLPVTDEAGEVLVRYLREGRPRTEWRELFLHARAPIGPLKRAAVTAILNRRLRRSALKLAPFGTHSLRHSLAVHLLRRGVSTKSIGDTLGHRDVASTAVYLRLNVDDLREVGLSAPVPVKPSALLERGWQSRFPRIREQIGPRRRSRRSFGSVFGPVIQRYLDHRRTLGRKYVMEEYTLRAWDKHLRRQDARTMDRQQFERWAKHLARLVPSVQRKRLHTIRNFLIYYAREHPGCFVPELGTFPKASPPRPPRLVSAAEMALLRATASGLGRSNGNPLRAEAVRLGLLLLFCCGLRSGELRRLQLRHYDAKEQLLRIEGSKFHKSRLVPLAPSVTKELEQYLAQRHCHGLPNHPESVLMWSGENSGSKAAYSATGLTTVWKHLCLSAGVLDHRGRPPRLHDLRHSFAVEALARWYTQKVDVQARLPHLATYLGHVNISSSYYYLQLTPALRAAASQRFHRAYGGLLRKGGAL